jgi:hypothetical protein
MFVRKLILLCLAVALLAPFADAKTPKPAKPNRHHRVRSHKAKFKKPKANWGSYKVKTKNQ